MANAIDVRDVRLRADGPAGGREVLRGVTLSIARGARVAVVGHSGSGKTTLLNIVGGLEPRFTGEVLIEGHAVWSESPARRAAYRNANIGFVFQDSNLIQGLTAEENLVLPLLLRHADDREERARTMLERFGLSARASTRVERLSGGERQRVATARALVVDPWLVLVDEPTGNLDGENALRIIDVLIDYQSARGATVLVATHDARVIERVERTIHMTDGVLNGEVS
jgi:lipoprotein-releasing system ATP-binding protein